MILVLGDILIDKFVLNDYKKKSPEANVPIINTKNIVTCLGGAANLINNINCLNKNCFLIGRIGKKNHDKEITQIFNKKKIKYKLFIQNNFSIGKKSRFYIDDKQICRIDDENLIRLNPSLENKIINFVKKNIKKYSLLVISDYNKGLISPKIYKKITKLFIKEKKNIITNPKKKNLKFYNGSNIIVPNQKEFDNFFKKKISFSNKVKKFFLNKNLEHLIITRGAKRLIHIDKKKKYFYKIEKKREFDVTGASDTFIALLSLSILNKENIKKSIMLAILGATNVVQKQFTSNVTKQEYLKLKKFCEKKI